MDREAENARVPQFDGSNYPQWKFRMLVLLEEHELKECIEQEAGEDDELVVKQEDAAAVREAKTKAMEK